MSLKPFLKICKGGFIKFTFGMGTWGLGIISYIMFCSIYGGPCKRTEYKRLLWR